MQLFIDKFLSGSRSVDNILTLKEHEHWCLIYREEEKYVTYWKIENTVKNLK